MNAAKAFAALVGVALLTVVTSAQRPASSAQRPAPSAQVPSPAAQRPTPTFDRDVAPLVFDRCASCHHEGGPAPFSVLAYESVRQHASQIAAVTKSRLMPPWRANSDYGAFVGQHPLSAGEIDLLQRWADGGALEGSARDLPPAPQVTDGWTLGKPDLVVTLPEPYTLAADGTDVFHIFVIPLPITTERFVRGLEFRPGNARVVHHANIRVDPTPASRRFDEQDPGLGYEGLIANSARYPDGHFLGWTPGQVAPLLPKGLAWRLEPGTDLVVEIHMQPSGRTESVQPSVGLFFGPDPPERIPTMLRLGRQDIDIPAGDSHYTITDSFVLPVDVEVEAVQPHAHQRASEITGTVTLPGGATKTLIHVSNWDFRWQQLYRFTEPFSLPKGTTLAMSYTYDNSAENLRNPDRPPREVFWGQRSADEMGDLWIQVLTKDEHDLDTLAARFRPKMVSEDVLGYEREILKNPSSTALHDSVALLYLEINRPADAAAHFAKSAALNPGSAPAYFNLGTALAFSGKVDEAIAQYRKALDLRPDYPQAHNNLAGMLLQHGRVAEALQHYQDAVRLNPRYVDAFQNMARAYAAAGQFDEAVRAVQAALALSPPEAVASTLREQLRAYSSRR